MNVNNCSHFSQYIFVSEISYIHLNFISMTRVLNWYPGKPRKNGLTKVSQTTTCSYVNEENRHNKNSTNHTNI